MKTIEVQNGLMEEQEGEGSSIHRDLLEDVFARVPLIDLACATRVSKSWEFAVSSSLAHINKVKPWLMIQTQNTTSLTKKITSHAYDPRSNTWVEIRQLLDPINLTTPLQSSGSNLLYELSFKGLAFSMDPLHCTWHHIPVPSSWRIDPIVAVVGPHVIVTGGGSNCLDDPLTVEMYDMEASCWSTCQPMPTILKDSTASTWLSVASNQHRMYVTEKASGITYSFSPETDAWYGPYDVRPDPSIYFSAIGFAGEEDLILAGLMGHPRHVETLKIWKVNPEEILFDEIGEIPVELLEKLKGENSEFLTSIALLATKDFIYIYKPSDPEEIIFCETVEGKCKWGSVKNLAFDDDCKIGKNMVISCSSVGISDLHVAINSGNLRFVVNSYV